MFAVIKTGGKQYQVAANDQIEVELLTGAPGDMVTFEEILLVGGDAGVTVGAPLVAGASVSAEIIEQFRTRKILVFKKRRRQNSKRSRGHRQSLTLVRINEILTNGAKDSGKKAAKAKTKAAPAADAAPAALASGGIDSSNLSLISGIGPTIEKKLRAAGVTSWEQIAAWTDADIAKYDEELALRGRVGREEWVQQASELLAGKPPRAKIDQAELKSGEDR
ncbi:MULTISPECIES: 50S ribosomal protein L21 [Kaistia]|uniref:Large ribosomal subunit protein bL21 n=1 Tax=Kaistia nematophila TaxID=2994654 RepID=A0A9X3E1G4_9HYPH|nr:50S ribosomal protein L21 [Kaistia nematophila]MBN9027643.1 50S ribosomal protein L21 [Hyphomicrobiales bacterium]MBN9059361.1 50S ribosomal protein L21 [Hyphomicrobiales bacterium]MCX5569981.1 50S ribosomal protein L21 [Kaistia nematophila]